MIDKITDVAEKGVQWGSDFHGAYRVLKRCYKPFLYISKAINVISCQKFAKYTKILKIADSTIKSRSPSSDITQKTGRSIAIYSIFFNGYGIYWVIPHVQRVQNMYGKGG